MNEFKELDLPLELEDLIENNLELTLVIHLTSNKFLNLEALMCVYRRHWSKEGQLETKMLDHCIVSIYFENAKDLHMAIHHVPWNFENGF